MSRLIRVEGKGAVGDMGHPRAVSRRDRSPKGCLSPTGDLTIKGLFAVLTNLYLEGNYGPVCKNWLALYSNSDKSFAGHYYELSVADVDILREAEAHGLLRVTSKGDVGACGKLSSSCSCFFSSGSFRQTYSRMPSSATPTMLTPYQRQHGS